MYDTLFKNRRKRNMIGEGYFGKVYKSKGIAMKVSTNKSTEHEFNVLKKLQNFDVPKVYEFKTYKDKYNVLFFEYIEGLTLKDWWKSNPSLQSKKSIIFQILSSILKIQKKIPSFRHRDLSIRNIIINKDLKPIIIDFGMVYYHGLKNPLNKKNCKDFDLFDIKDKCNKMYDIHYFLCSVYSLVSSPTSINDRKIKNFILSVLKRKYIHDSEYVKYGRILNSSSSKPNIPNYEIIFKVLETI